MADDEREDDEATAVQPGLAAPRGLDDFEGQRQKQLIAAAIFGRAPKPTMLDRYTVIRELGAGAMGKVYLAYDDQLDRRVAIKLLHGGRSSQEAKLRLQREAQAMAKLSHPNVVTVYEVGSFEGELFVAMEYIPGQNLSSWLAAEAREPEAIRELFLAAGTGLAAAHEVGLVHRDFKPDNVLVGEDGRARVADFGLAYGLHGGGEAEAEAERAIDDGTSSSSNRLAESLTRTGAVIGTPAYMSPEQVQGRPTDPRSDQFSFCVALWEAIHGQRPFLGGNMIELSTRIATGELEPPPEPVQGGIRAWMHAVALRGLASDPEARWPDMAALLDALADDPDARRRRRWRWAAVLTTTAALLAVLAGVAAKELRDNARHRYWSTLTEQLLEIERERGFRQAKHDAQQARDATKMSVYRSYRAKIGVVDHEDPTVAAVLLREVGEAARANEAWISAANLTLGRPLSQARLTGHRDTIFALEFSAGEDALYSAAADGEVRRWDLTTGRGELLYTHEGRVNTLAQSPDGERLVSASEDGTVRAWRPGEASEILIEGEAGFTEARFDPSGRRLIATARDGSARLLDVQGGAPRLLAAAGPAVLAADFDGEGQRVITAAADGQARLWRVADGALLASLEGHEAGVYQVRFAGEHRVVTGSDDGTVRLWSLDGEAGPGEGRILVEHGAAVAALDLHGDALASAAVDGGVFVTALAGDAEPVRLEGHEAGVWALAFSPDGGEVITASFDGTARVFPADGRGPQRVLTGHHEPLLRLALSPSGRWLATGSWDTEVRVWDLDRPLLETPLRGHRGRLQSVRVDGDGARVLTASSDRSARIWDARSGATLARLEAGRPLNVAVFSPDGSRVAAGRDNGAITVWTPASDERRELLGHEGGIRDLAFSPAGERLASASSDGSARIWAVAGDEAPLVLTGHRGLVLRVRFDAEGERLITASVDGTARIWDAREGAELAVLAGHSAAIEDLALSPDGRVLATASEDHDARLWPGLSGAEPLVLRGHDKRIHAVAFDADGARVVTASADGSARVWDASTGESLAILRGHSGALWDARFVGEHRVLSAGDDNSLRLWSLTGEHATIVLTGHDDAVTNLALGPEHAWAVSASADGEARIWRLDQLSADPRELGRRLRAATLTCLGREQRILELGEAPAEAELALAACERSHGR